MWSSLMAVFRQQWLNSKELKEVRARENEGGPSCYLVRRHRLGNRLLSLSKRMLADGALSPSKAAAILGVKPNNVFSLTDGVA